MKLAKKDLIKYNIHNIFVKINNWLISWGTLTKTTGFFIIQEFVGYLMPNPSLYK